MSSPTNTETRLSDTDNQLSHIETEFNNIAKASSPADTDSGTCLSNTNDQLNNEETELKYCSEMTTCTGIASGTKESNTNDQLNHKETESNLSYEISETCLPYKEIHDHIINEDILSDPTRGDNLITAGAPLDSGVASPKI